MTSRKPLQCWRSSSGPCRLTTVLVDDAGYGMLRFDQELAGEDPFGVDLVVPDFEALAAVVSAAGPRHAPGDGLAGVSRH